MKETMDFTFNQIESNEKDIVLDLLKEAAEKISKMNIDHWQNWKNHSAQDIKWVEEGINNNEFFFINTLDNQNLGMVRILNEDKLYWGDQEHKSKYIHSLVINEAYNGKGYGNMVLQKIAHKAIKENCKYLRLDADSQNPKLCAYYENLGFQKVGLKKLNQSVYNLYQKELIL